MNSCNTDIFFSTYYHLQSVRFELNFLTSSLYVGCEKYFFCNWLKVGTVRSGKPINDFAYEGFTVNSQSIKV